VEVGAYGEDGEVVCFVRDNGAGVDPRFHDKIFGLFERLNPHVDGTGIGLALVKRIIEVHHGRIWIDSEGDGGGATFYFAVPAHK
jgi:signal transduction histidine kinase